MSKNSRQKHAGTEEMIVAGHEGPLLRYAGLILGDSSLAQDVVERAFILVYKGKKKRCSHLPGDELTAELYRAVHNAAIEAIPAGTRCSGEAGGVSSPVADARQRVIEAVRSLEPEERQVVILKIFERLNNPEISRITLVSEEKVAILLYKSVIKMAAELKKAGLL